MDLTLYHCMSARSFRPLWLLEELQLPYKLVMLPFPPRMLERSYLEMNPLGTVPLLLHGSTRMTESAAICEYLAALSTDSTLTVRADEPEFGSYLNYLHFGEATLTFPQTLVLRYTRLEPEGRRQPAVADDYSRWFLARLRSLEGRLERHEFLCGSRFTAADISVGYALFLADYLELSVQFTDRVANYWRHLKQRPAFLRALESQEVAARAQGVSVVPAPLAMPPVVEGSRVPRI